MVIFDEKQPVSVTDFLERRASLESPSRSGGCPHSWLSWVLHVPVTGGPAEEALLRPPLFSGSWTWILPRVSWVEPHFIHFQKDSFYHEVE